MRPEIRRLLTEVIPPAVGCSFEVANIVMESGDEKKITKYIKSRLSDSLAKFITQNILLDGSDGFLLDYDPDHDVTVCRAQLHVLTPKQLRDILQYAYNMGQSDVKSTYYYYPDSQKFPA